MNNIYDDNSLSIGHTPLIKLNRITAGLKTSILAKIEGRNPAYSVKCRIGASMIWDAEKTGLLKAGMEVVEATSGNTGIALAYVCAARGYKLTLTMPESMSIERRKIFAAFGANLVLTPASKGMPGAIEKADAMEKEGNGKIFIPRQFENPANPLIHETTTGPEIWKDTNGEVDVIVAGVGTGGTIAGISRYLKNVKKKAITTVAVEPATSPVISQNLEGKTLAPGAHKIQGIGAGFIPKNLELSLIDLVEKIDDDEAFETSRRMAKEEGILCGISSGAAVAASLKISRLPEFEDKTIVAIIPDSGERYLSTNLF